MAWRRSDECRCQTKKDYFKAVDSEFLLQVLARCGRQVLLPSLQIIFDAAIDACLYRLGAMLLIGLCWFGSDVPSRQE
jgi:hypothetical protein